jgi:hypothetical protein
MYINDTEIPIPLWKKFKIELRKQGRSTEWLADMIGLGYEHTRLMLAGKRPIIKKNEQNISECLGLVIDAE